MRSSLNLREKRFERYKAHRSVILATLLTGILAALYAGLLANKTMPPTEGWYTYYAYLINEEGAIPYVDFELLFPPLYTYLIALFTKVFGYSILALRVFGVCIYAATAMLACLIFEKLTNRSWLGLLGGVLTVAVLQSEVVQVFYDYIRIMDLFVYASVYCFLRYLNKVRLTRSREEGTLPPRFDWNVALGACFAVLASMCKQSSGLIFLLFCIAFFVFLWICLTHKKELALQLGVILGITLVLYGIMSLFLLSQGAFGAYIRYNFVSSVDSKGGGSMLNILFGWIPRSKVALLRGLAFLLLPVCLLIGSVLLSIFFPAREKELHPRFVKILKIVTVALLILSIVLSFLFGGFAAYVSKFMSNITMYVVFLFGTLFFVLASFALIFRKWIPRVDWHRHCKYVFLSGVVFTLSYSVCTSGGLAESQTALGFSFMVLVLMVAASYRKREITVAALSLLMVFQTAVCFSRKVQTTYAWWGLETGSVSEQTETCEVPIFKGIKMSPLYADMYNDVYQSVTANSDPGDEIFVFPHLPVIYIATDRPRATYTAIQWFDVATDEAILADIEVIREKKPKIIVLCEIGEYPMKSHETSFRGEEASGLRQMQEFLQEFVLREGYVADSFNRLLPNNPETDHGYEITVWYLPD